ncbi:hypothetical protein [Altererythrobacter fulvus]|uniref:hypothetical protein n=1 Tax=Caenibius fulvus TaxID=2126012 RepID=UPI003016682A
MRPGSAFAFAALLGLAACQPGPAPEPASESADESAPERAPESTGDARVRVGPITSAEELEGIYRVADIEGIDMAALDRGLAVEITRDRIDVLESCVSSDWAYRFEGQQLITSTIEDPTCRRAVFPEEAAIMRAFTGASRVSRTAANGILFEGSGGSVTLFSQ